MSVSPALRATGLSALALGSVLALSGCGAITSLIGGGNVFEISVGDCFVESEMNAAFATGEVSDVPLVECTEEHDAEVYYTEDLPEGDFPGTESVDASTEEICYGDNFTDFVGVSYDESEIYAGALYPTEESWNQLDDREVACYLITQGEMVTGTLAGANR
ncbi:septum formation family protein [Nocardiopsis sp. CA-288880]|uniref:septum formation family protein n=1 Tax=Nocardiopsis sp. CA-288880 TaxID=3239995 RepID=UPI003D9806F0